MSTIFDTQKSVNLLGRRGASQKSWVTTAQHTNATSPLVIVKAASQHVSAARHVSLQLFARHATSVRAITVNKWAMSNWIKMDHQ